MIEQRESGKFKSALTCPAEGIESTFIVFLSTDKLQTKFQPRSAYLRTVVNERECNCLTLLVAKAKVPVTLRKREQSHPFARNIAIIFEGCRIHITFSKKCINIFLVSRIEIACDIIYLPMNNNYIYIRFQN